MKRRRKLVGCPLKISTSVESVRASTPRSTFWTGLSRMAFTKNDRKSISRNNNDDKIHCDDAVDDNVDVGSSSLQSSSKRPKTSSSWCPQLVRRDNRQLAIGNRPNVVFGFEISTSIGQPTTGKTTANDKTSIQFRLLGQLLLWNHRASYTFSEISSVFLLILFFSGSQRENKRTFGFEETPKPNWTNEWAKKSNLSCKS